MNISAESAQILILPCAMTAHRLQAHPVNGIVLNNAKAGAFAANLTLRLVAGQAVPLSWVMAYNKLISSEKE